MRRKERGVASSALSSDSRRRCSSPKLANKSVIPSAENPVVFMMAAFLARLKCDRDVGSHALCAP
jgi:hypothetical protein